MPPRDLDDSDCKEKQFSGECEETEGVEFAPRILHKKHRVIKLVKNQLLSLRDQGIINEIQSSKSGSEVIAFQEPEFVLKIDEDHRRIPERITEAQQGDSRDRKFSIACAVFLLISLFLILLAAVWIAAGPLSKSSPRTPIPWGSLVKIDGVCELEKKYLLRWSTPNYFG